MAAADRPVLIRYAAAAARNALDLVEDAELLIAAGRLARAYSLAALAVEEIGKACGLVALAMMPDHMRVRAPVRELLEWHALKQLGGQLADVLAMSTPGVAGRLAETSTAQLAEILSRLGGQARDTDLAKKRGFYVDLDDRGQIREPSEVNEAEARDAIARARGVTAAASMLNDASALARLADPPTEALEIESSITGAYLQSRDIDSPEAAAEWIAPVVKSLSQTEVVSQTADSGDPDEPPGGPG